VKFPRIYALSEYALTVEFGDAIDPDINGSVIALRDHLSREPFPGLKEMVPAYTSLTIYYSPGAIREQVPGSSAADTVALWLEARIGLGQTDLGMIEQGTEIPVCYDPSLGTDLSWVAEYCGLSPQQVVDLHTSRSYRVYMIGFVPGFPYMGITDPVIHVPRKQQPARIVPQGSVALAGGQTGIYPADIPGGWQVIGRTPLVLFDPRKEPLTTLRAGMTVRFRPISLQAYHEMAQYGDKNN
jgi:inhibitor of KinA